MPLIPVGWGPKWDSANDTLNSTKSIGDTSLKGFNQNVKKYNKSLLMRDLQNMQEGKLGLSEAQRAQMRDESARGASNMLEAQNTQLAQMGLTGNAGEANAAIRDSQKALAEAGAIGASEANRLSESKAMAQEADIKARLRQAEQDQIEKNRFWTELILSNAGALGDFLGSAVSAIGGGVGGGAEGLVKGAQGAAGAIP